MVYYQKYKGSHLHKWFVDANTGDKVCLCGVTKGNEVKRAKYHNHSQTYNGITYHSKLEANYAAELDYRIRAGDVKSWERQVKLDLRINGKHITNYFIDFVVKLKDCSYQFTEIKGMVLGEWLLKFKILEATFDDHKRTPDDVLLIIKEVNTTFRPKKLINS
ncbi:MAG: DUF1064 domain-containing protein [Patescibacteria group bacterium]